MSKVRGDNVIGFIQVSGVWVPYICALSCTLSRATSEIETSVVGAGKNATFRPQKNSFTCSIAGLVTFDETNVVTLGDLENYWRAQTTFLFRMQRTNKAGTVYTSEFSAFITSLEDTGAVGSMASFSASLRGTGALTNIYTPTIINPGGGLVYNYQYVSAGAGESFFIANGSGGTPDIRNKTILGAWKGGLEHRVILTGTPVGREVKYTASTGRFDWAIPFDTSQDAANNFENALIQYQ